MPQPTTEQLKELEKLSAGMLTPEGYERLIKYCSRNRITLPLSNGHWKHATILLKEFFFTGEDHIYILSGELYTNAFDDNETIQNARTFMGKGGKLHIAFTDTVRHADMLKRPFVEALMAEVSSNQKGTFLLRDASSIAPSQKHFMVVDKRGFRFETDHKQRIATANFDYPEIAIRLEETFNSTFEKSIPVFPKAVEKENVA